MEYAVSLWVVNGPWSSQVIETQQRLLELRQQREPTAF